jgi:hypothetical protein
VTRALATPAPLSPAAGVDELPTVLPIEEPSKSINELAKLTSTGKTSGHIRRVSAKSDEAQAELDKELAK